MDASEIDAKQARDQGKRQKDDGEDNEYIHILLHAGCQHARQCILNDPSHFPNEIDSLNKERQPVSAQTTLLLL